MLIRFKNKCMLIAHWVAKFIPKSGFNYKFWYNSTKIHSKLFSVPATVTRWHTQQNCKFSDYHNSCCWNYELSFGCYAAQCALFLLKFWSNKLPASSGWLNWSRWPLNSHAGRRCVSYVGMLEAFRSNTATGRSVSSHIPNVQIFSDVTPCHWISESWHSEGSKGPSSSGSSNNAEKPQILQILTLLPHSVSVIGRIPTTFL